MHCPDFILEPWIWITFFIISVGILVISFYKLRKEDINLNKLIPYIGILAAFIFAAQFVNFPVFIAPAVSGHLVGGTLIAAIISPYAGIFVMTLVLLVQMFMTDGGVTTYGVNLFNMGVIGCFFGFFLMFGLVKLLKGRINDKTNFIMNAGIASYLSIVIAAVWFGMELALSSNWTKLDPALGGILIFLMFFWHAIIGIGETTITVLVLLFIVKVKPDIIATAEILGIKLTREV